MLALNIQNLSKQYPNGVQALSDANLTVEEGDFFALLGYNGAGKTTMIGIITGLVNKTAGKVEVFGYNIDTQNTLAKHEIGVVPQEFNFSIFEKVQDIIVKQGGYFGIPREQALIRSEELLKQLDLWDKRNMPARTLSGGMKRRLMIARALIHKPRLLILDEPTAGVDVELRRGMWEYLQKINQEGTTIILTTHYLEEAEMLCKNVAIIKQGSVIKQDSMKNLLRGVEKETYTVDIEGNLGDFQPIQNFTISPMDENTLEVEIAANQTLNDFILKLTERNIKVTGMRAKENRLEELFVNILNQN